MESEKYLKKLVWESFFFRAEMMFTNGLNQATDSISELLRIAIFSLDKRENKVATFDEIMALKNL